MSPRSLAAFRNRSFSSSVISPVDESRRNHHTVCPLHQVTFHTKGCHTSKQFNCILTQLRTSLVFGKFYFKLNWSGGPWGSISWYVKHQDTLKLVCIGKLTRELSIKIRCLPLLPSAHRVALGWSGVTSACCCYDYNS